MIPRKIVRFFRPRSLMGQMLLAVAAALLLVQGLGAVLIYRAQREGYEASTLNTAAFRLLLEARGPDSVPRFDRAARSPFTGGPPPRGYPIEYRKSLPMHAREVRDAHLETRMRSILGDQSFPVAELMIVHRTIGSDPIAVWNEQRRAEARRLAGKERNDRKVADRNGPEKNGARDDAPDATRDSRPDDGRDQTRSMQDHLLVVAVRPHKGDEWMVARVRSPRASNVLLRPLMVQTLVMYLVLIGVVALILRRMTRPLAALTRRVEQFAVAPGAAGQLAPSGPEDMQHLIEAHNAMEGRIVAMLDEKDVMLGAIGHDLKTPLAALRVRIESVPDDAERGKMARTIEDIVHTLDDILSLARVGRPSDPRERTELSALVSSVVEEYEDMGDPVEQDEAERIVLELRATWLRRALRNLISNALRYGERARVSLVREGRNAVIRIEDDGPGIPDDSIEDMMNAFTRGDPSRNSATGGAGLGLALARAIAEQHGGSLVLANRRDEGGAVVGLTATLAIPV